MATKLKIVAKPLTFAPVPFARSRCDGWSPAVQRAFVAALARGATVTAAAGLVGRSRQKAYALRARPGAAAFAAAWDAAVDIASRRRQRQRRLPVRPVARPGTIAEGRLVWAQLARLDLRASRLPVKAKVTKFILPPNRKFSEGDIAR